MTQSLHADKCLLPVRTHAHARPPPPPPPPRAFHCWLLQSLAIAEPLEGGRLLPQYRQLAASTGVWLSLGGFQEAGPDASHLHNTHVIIDAHGALVANYRKVGGWV